MSRPRFKLGLSFALATALQAMVACEDRPASEVRPEGTALPAEPTAPTETLTTDPAATAPAGTGSTATPYQPAPAHPWDGQPGSEMPAYTALALDGSPVNLADLRGQPVLLNFWATWCVPCRTEFDDLTALQARFAGAGLRVVGVSLDHTLEAAQVATFAQSQPIDYTLWHDPSGEVPAFGVPPLPGNFIFDRQGRLAWSAIGAPPGSLEALAAAVEQVVAAP